VVTLLRENRARLDALAEALLEHETLDEEDAYKVAGVPHPEATPAETYSAAARSTTRR
jgi:cell division protease FtsH